MSLSERLSHALVRRSGWILTAVVVLTVLFALAFLLLPPTSSASQEPPGETFEARDLADARLASSVHRSVFIIEARDGNMLAREPLLELLQNTRRLQTDSEVGPKLVRKREPALGGEVIGLSTLADAVDAALRAVRGRGLEDASQADIDAAIARILADARPSDFGLSAKTTFDPSTDRWVAPAILTYVLADGEAVGGVAKTAVLGVADTRREEFARAVQSLLRGDEEHLQVWGLAIDVNLTSAEQGRTAGPYIGFTVLAVLVVLGLVFRSYWSVAVTGFALGALIIWLKGLSNLVGLKDDLILSIIVPIAMISFGVDFAFHAIGRYREERASGSRSPRRALEIGLGGVLGALALAAASDSSAFLANTTAGIESLVQFGVAATLATVSAFVVLGIATPLALMLIEERVDAARGRGGVVLAMAGGLLACLLAMASVIVSVFVLPWLGVVLLFVHLGLFIVGPLAIASRAVPPAKSPRHDVKLPGSVLGSATVASAAAWMARARLVVLPVVGLLTVGSAYMAQRIEPSFDVRDFFAESSDFVVALDRFDEHVGEQGGEPAFIYVEADLTQPAVLRVLGEATDTIRGLETDRLARDGDGEIRVETGVLVLVDAVLGSPAARQAIEQDSKVAIADEDGDGVPDSPDQLAALFESSRALGVPGGTRKDLALAPEAVRQLVWHSREGTDDRHRAATRIDLRIPGSREQENIEAVRSMLAPIVEDLETDLRGHDPNARAVLTGQPIVRQASLDAILRTFRLSIPVAVVLCIVVAAVFMRSLRYAAVCTLPVIAVVAWLYALMVAMGYSINVVTATIGAISIGIGIDFSVHFTMRFREEMMHASDRCAALRAAASGTGGALAASGMSSIIGFAILALAPMPMFAAYGFLTAIMIGLAMLATLLLLPPLLFVVTPGRRGDAS